MPRLLQIGLLGLALPNAQPYTLFAERMETVVWRPARVHHAENSR